MMHVSEFPPDDDAGPFVSVGWDGEVNTVESEETGETYRVDHSERSDESDSSEE